MFLFHERKLIRVENPRPSYVKSSEFPAEVRRKHCSTKSIELTTSGIATAENDEDENADGSDEEKHAK